MQDISEGDDHTIKISDDSDGNISGDSHLLDTYTSSQNVSKYCMRKNLSFTCFSYKSGLRPDELDPDEDVEQLPRYET